MSRNSLLYPGFMSSVRTFSDRPAITVVGQTLTYTQPCQKAASLAAIANQEIAEEPLLTAVFTYRSVTAFVGVLDSLMRGHGYVPLKLHILQG